MGRRGDAADGLLDHRRADTAETFWRSYADATGHAPMLPGVGGGILAVQAALPTQEELLGGRA